MKKLKVPNIVTIMILTVITILFWIILSVIRIFQKEPTPTIPSEILNPFNSSYDKSVVDKIEKRIYFDKEQVFTSPTVLPEI
ncbi:MAG: hypothetical protein AAB954_01310 [Patescibacteria group bacterium]